MTSTSSGDGQAAADAFDAQWADSSSHQAPPLPPAPEPVNPLITDAQQVPTWDQDK